MTIGRILEPRSETLASTGVPTGAWHPKTDSERQLVRSQLERIVSDAGFASSNRYPHLLRYIVEQTLAENQADLKERTLGVAVFHRSPDYDSNRNPIVRLCATQVRRRLVRYYQSPAHAGELRIELSPGSYVPVFSPPVPDAPAIKVIPGEVPSEAEQVSPPKRTRNIYLPTALAALVVVGLVILVWGTRYWRQFEKTKSALEQVWSPLLTSRNPILFCMGASKVTFPGGSQLAELQNGADEDSFSQAFPDKNDFVPFSDMQILIRFLSLVQAHGHAFRIQNFRTTVSSQLREGPVVLIGALNNDWTLNRTSSLRFHLQASEGPDHIYTYWIADTQHPDSRAWHVSAQARSSNVLKDYAIAARFTDEGTGQVVLVAAGITGSGTRAAGEFLTDEADLKQLAESAGADWGKGNFEVVLGVQVVNGVQGKPKVEAKAFW